MVVLGDIARERRGEVVAQRQPLLVVVLEREYALVRPVLIGEEFAERLGLFHERRLERLKTIERVDVADLCDHGFGGRDVGQAVRSMKPRGSAARARAASVSIICASSQAVRGADRRPHAEERGQASRLEAWPSGLRRPGAYWIVLRDARFAGSSGRGAGWESSFAALYPATAAARRGWR